MSENSSILNADGKIGGHPAKRVFQRPDEILSDPNMSRAEKRAVLTSWASDARAVPGAPSLRELEDGSHIEVDDILFALKVLDAGHGIQSSQKQPTSLWLRPLERRRLPASRTWSRFLRQRSRDDDDDPPPCPAYAAIPPRQGGGGAVANPELVPA